MTAPLSDRIQFALKGGKSDGVSALIDEAKLAAAQAESRAADAKLKSLDPLLSAAEIAAVRKEAEDALFDAERMVRASQVLTEALATFRAKEESARVGAIVAKAVAKRDAASDRLKAEYPGLANKIGELLAAVAAADQAVDDANRVSGGARIERVEVHARPNGANLYVRGGPWLTDMRILSLFGGDSVIWGRDPHGSLGLRLDPEPATPVASDPTAAAKAGEPVLQRPGSPVRLVMHDKGAAA